MKTKKENNKSAEFDFKTINTFEDACKKEDVNPNELPDVSTIPEKYRKEFGNALISNYRLFVIFKAINNGWIPDFTNRNQLKYYPWFIVSASGFAFQHSDFGYAGTNSGLGARLCTDTSEKALYIAKQFEQDWKNILL